MVDRGRDFENKGDFLEHVSPNQEVFIGDEEEDSREYQSAVTYVEDLAEESDFDAEREINIEHTEGVINVDPTDGELSVNPGVYTGKVLQTNSFEWKGCIEDPDHSRMDGIAQIYDGESGRAVLHGLEEDSTELTYLLFKDGQVGEPDGIPEISGEKSSGYGEVEAVYNTEISESNLDELWNLIKFDKAFSQNNNTGEDVNIIEYSSRK